MKIKNNKVNARELHEQLKSKQPFSMWISQKIKQADLIEGLDFLTSKLISTGGRPATEYEITIEAAKEICLLQQTTEGHRLRRELIKISAEKDNLELLTISQSALAHRLINCMRYIDNAKKAEELHLNSYINNQTASNKPDSIGVLCAKFHQHRNAVLNIEKDYIDSKLREYCIENTKPMPKSKNKTDKLIFMGMEYDVFRNAIFDLLKSKGTVEDISLKFANTVKRIAQEAGESIYRKNEDNLFQERISLPEPKDLLLKP